MVIYTNVWFFFKSCSSDLAKSRLTVPRSRGLIQTVLVSPVGLHCLFLSLVCEPLQHESCNRTFLQTLPPTKTPQETHSCFFWLCIVPQQWDVEEGRGGEGRKCGATYSQVSLTDICWDISMCASTYLTLFMSQVDLSHMRIQEASDSGSSCYSTQCSLIHLTLKLCLHFALYWFESFWIHTAVEIASMLSSRTTNIIWLCVSSPPTWFTDSLTEWHRLALLRVDSCGQTRRWAVGQTEVRCWLPRFWLRGRSAASLLVSTSIQVKQSCNVQSNKMQNLTIF